MKQNNYDYEDMYLDEMTEQELERELDIIKDSILPYNVRPCCGCSCNNEECEACIDRTREMIQDELDNRGINWEAMI